MARLCNGAFRLVFLVVVTAGAWGAASGRGKAQLRGLAADGHFSINAPNQAAADWLLAEAQRLRRRLALRWLGAPLPPGRGMTVIHWELAPDHDEGTTSPALAPPRRRHLVWLRTSPQRVRETLAHEMVHVVLFTHFGNSLPIWLHEGVAATEDDPATRAKRERIFTAWVQSGRLPRLGRLLAKGRIRPEEQQAYTASALLTEYLLARADARRLFRFGQLGLEQGWDHAAQAVYGAKDIAALEQDWHRWLRQRAHGAVALRPRPGVRLR